MPNYLAFTIGPIYQTMTSARYTRELWASSYLFSYLVKEISRRIQDQDGIPGSFVIPAIPEVQTSTHGAGIFPDRFIYETKEPNQLPELQKILDKTLEHVANKMQQTAGITGVVLPFLKNYLKLYALEIPLDPEENVILKIMSYLDSMELQHNFSATDEPFLRQLFDRVTKSFLVVDGFGEKQHSFETILEVATRDFSELTQYKAITTSRTEKQFKVSSRAKSGGAVPLEQAIAAQTPTVVDEEQAVELDELEPIAEEADLINYLTEHHRATRIPAPAKIFRPAHKYIAVVQADGDNVGAVIGQLTPEKYLSFSNKLSEFALGAVQEIVDFGGMNIYAGGDDLLFFAPLLRKKETIFDLLIRLDNLFIEAFKDFPVAANSPHPTLSFGVSVTYYKFPLYEAREAAAKQLFGVAKHTYPEKNTIGLRVQKHSGQPFSGAFRINKPSFQQLLTLLKFSSETDGQMLTSITHKIDETKFLLKQIGHDQQALQAFFDNSFDEEVHTNHAKDFLKAVVHLLNACFTENLKDLNDPKAADKALDAAYALLRTHRFLTSTELN